MQAGRESSRAQRDKTTVFIARKDNSQVIAVGYIVDKQSILFILQLASRL